MFLLIPFCLFILSLSCISTHAQVVSGKWATRKECIDYCQQAAAYGPYRTTLQWNHTIPMGAWCRAWHFECLCIWGECANFDIKCNYVDTGGDSDDHICFLGESNSGVSPPSHTIAIFQKPTQILFLQGIRVRGPLPHRQVQGRPAAASPPLKIHQHQLSQPQVQSSSSLAPHLGHFSP